MIQIIIKTDYSSLDTKFENEKQAKDFLRLLGQVVRYLPMDTLLEEVRHELLKLKESSK